MTRDQKALLLFQLDNIIDLGDAITDDKRMDLIKKVRAYVDEMHTGKRQQPSPTSISKNADDV